MSRSRPEHEWRGRDVHVDESASVARSILWNDVDIGAGSVLDECIVTDGVKVPAGAVYRRSILVRANGTLSMTSFDAT
jgi:ADP-glucose pyrophosphorylase